MLRDMGYLSPIQEAGMRISVPFSYDVKAVPFRHKLESNLKMLEHVWVDVPEVRASDVESVITVSDAEGNEIERVFGYGGMFWVKDARGVGDPEFLPQHLIASGQKVPKQSNDRFSKEDSVKNAVTQLGQIGMLRMRTAGLEDYYFRQFLYNGPEGKAFVEKTVESEAAKKVSASNRDQRMARAGRLASEHAITVDGVLYHRVAEPSMSTGKYWPHKVEWKFGCGDFLTEAGLRDAGYPVSAKDYERIPDWFERESTSKLEFRFDVLDETYFRLKTDRMALVASAQRVVSNGLANTRSTPFILSWCAMRDHLQAMWTGTDGVLTKEEFLNLDIGEFERLAELLEHTGSFGVDLDLQGLRMWDSRAVALKFDPPGMAL
jgi:hypothetical protein